MLTPAYTKNRTDPTPAADDLVDGLSGIGSGIKDAWDYGYEVTTDAADDVGDFMWRNRGTLATLGSVGVCLVPAVGYVGCAYAAGAAFVARSSRRIETDGFRASLQANLADAGMTYRTVGLGGAFESAGEGIAFNYVGRLVPSGYDFVGLMMWLDESCVPPGEIA
jgi:hypothetical protein